MKIGELAAASGVSAKMIRHYEAVGLIAAGTRHANNYRDYGPRDVHELRFIRSARDLGFSLDEICALLDLWRDRSRRSRDVQDLARRHLEEVEGRIRDLQAIAGTLRHLIGGCAGDHRPDCPILDRLAHTATPTAPDCHVPASISVAQS